MKRKERGNKKDEEKEVRQLEGWRERGEAIRKFKTGSKYDEEKEERQ